MASDAEELVLSISADTRQILNAMKRLTGEIGRSTAGIQKHFDGVGKGIDRAMTTAMQKRIDEMVGIAERSTKQWTGVLADHGKEMERLRSRFNPLFSTVNQYKSSIGEIRAAHRLGAISADEMTAAISRERQAALASISAIKARNAALADTPALRGPGAFNTANIAAQLQDIGVTASMGMNPMTIALQQGTQLSAVFEQLRANGQSTGQAIAAAFQSILSPMSLVTIGVVAAGAALAQYVMSGGKEVESFDDMIKRHEANIRRLGPAYENALQAAKAYSSSPEVARAILADRTRELEERLAKETKDAAARIRNAVEASVQEALGKTTAQTLQEAYSESRFKPFEDAIRRLEEGAISARDFHDEIVRIADQTPEFAAASRELRSFVADVLDISDAASNSVVSVSNLKHAVNNFKAELDGVRSERARKELTDLMERARETGVSADEVKAALGRISGYAPDLTSAISSFRALFAEIENARQAAVGFAGKESQGGRVRYNQSGFMQLPGSAPTPDRRVDPYFLPPDPKGRGGRAPKRTPDDRFFEDIEAIKQRTMALIEERSQIGMTYEAQVRRKTAFDLEQKALKDVREAARQKGDQDWQNAQLTPEQVRQIDEVSAAYARQAAEYRKTYEEMQYQRDMLDGVMTDLRQALADGKLEWKEFADIAISVLDKIINKIQDELLDAIFQVGRAGGGGSSLLGFIGSLFGLGGGIRLPGTAPIPTPAPRASGGPVRAGMPYIVGEKRPELFVPDQNGTIIPRVPELPRPVVAPRGGGETPVVIHVDVTGARGNAEIMEMVEVGVSRGIKQYDKGSLGRFAKNFQEYPTRFRVR